MRSMKKAAIVGALLVSGVCGLLAPSLAQAGDAVLAGSVSPAHPLHMQTEQRFGASDALRVWVYVNGREVGESEGNHCIAYYYRRGVSVRLATCGAGPLKVTAAGMRSARVRVRVSKLP